MVSKHASLLFHFALVLAAISLAGCQTAPVQEMSDARQAIMVATEAGATDYAAAELEAAMRFLENAEKHLSERAYADARRDALQAKENALQALSISESRKERESP